MIVLLLLGLAGLVTLLSGGGSGPRSRVIAAVAQAIPSNIGTEKFDSMLGPARGPGKFAYYEEGYGTTCGVVVASLLERSGCNPLLINRGARFGIGAHISRLLAGAKEIGAWRPGLDGIQGGDVYYVSSPEHVGFWLERVGDWVVTADGGQTNEAGRQAARIRRRRIRRAGDGWELSAPDGGGPWRKIVGHVDVNSACSASRPT